MNFLTGITNLTSWMGNVIMPTLAALFFALGVLRYAHGQAHTYAPWAGFLCLMVSRVLQRFVGFMLYAGVGHRMYAGGAWMRHFSAAALCLALSGVLRLAEWFIAQGLGGIRDRKSTRLN